VKQLIPAFVPPMLGDNDSSVMAGRLPSVNLKAGLSDTAGARSTDRLPLARGASPTLGATVAVILIVDDEQAIRDLVSSMMQDEGFATIEAVNGAHALALIEATRPDLIISDVMMPLVDGVELTRQLKAKVDTRAIPVVLISAAEGHVAREAVADDYLAKPFDLEHLLDIVHRLMAS
jgi:CheY-like chemotaxis protein